MSQSFVKACIFIVNSHVESVNYLDQMVVHDAIHLKTTKKVWTTHNSSITHTNEKEDKQIRFSIILLGSDG